MRTIFPFRAHHPELFFAWSELKYLGRKGLFSSAIRLKVLREGFEFLLYPGIFGGYRLLAAIEQHITNACELKAI